MGNIFKYTLCNALKESVSYRPCCLSEGFLAYPMMSEPKTEPIPAPEPATPTVAAPAPMNLAALSMSLRATEVWRARV